VADTLSIFISVCSFFDTWRISTTRQRFDWRVERNPTPATRPQPPRGTERATKTFEQSNPGLAKSSRKRQASVLNTNGIEMTDNHHG
jgi:hypothetical protein